MLFMASALQFDAFAQDQVQHLAVWNRLPRGGRIGLRLNPLFDFTFDDRGRIRYKGRDFHPLLTVDNDVPGVHILGVETTVFGPTSPIGSISYKLLCSISCTNNSGPED